MATEDRAFPIYRAGWIRDNVMLAIMRNGLRVLINPETGEVFSEDEIQRATQAGSSFWIEANSIDIVQLGKQARAFYLAQQVRMDRAGSGFLKNYHGRLWGETPLDASGGSGEVTAKATAGTIYIGSTTPGDPVALTATDPAGKHYQVLVTETADGAGDVTCTLLGLDGGSDTNLVAGTVLNWVAPTPGMQPTCTVSIDFEGGAPAESDADFADRMAARVRHKPAAGNAAHFRSWARSASNTIEDAFISSCFLYAGSTMVCVTQKRLGNVGPHARIASLGTLATLTAFIVPPGSPVVPGQAFIVVTTPNFYTSDLGLQLSMQRGNNGGWADLNPWPGFTAALSLITVLTTQTSFRINSDTDLPNSATSLSGADAPKLMAWNPTTSRWVQLLVTSVTDAGGGLFDVVLSSPPAMTLSANICISPFTARKESIAQAVEGYFDGLGPGELVDSSDPRYARAARFPIPAEAKPYRAGQNIVGVLQDALGAAITTSLLGYISAQVPPVNADPILGPNMLTLGKLGIYDLP